jgi:hypothetical protein
MLKRVVICDGMIALAAGGLPAAAQDGAADLRKGRIVRTPAGMASQLPNALVALSQPSLALQKKIDRSRMKAPIQSTMIGMKGLTFRASCDSSVAIAPAK